MKTIDNAVIHSYPSSPFIVKACLNLRQGKRIVHQIPMSCPRAVLEYLAYRWPEIPYRIINHKEVNA